MEDSSGYQNVPTSPTKDESYTTVGEFLQGRSEQGNLDNSEDREYYNYIPGENTDKEMYVYMQSGLAGAEGKTTSDNDRMRSEEKVTQSARYVNLSKHEGVNRDLPGSEYGEIADGPDSKRGVANKGVHPHDDGKQPIYANFEEEELYTAMS